MNTHGNRLGRGVSPGRTTDRALHPGSIIYLVAFALLRLFPRESGSTNTTDLLVLVFIADAAQNGMSANYQSLTDGLILVATIVLLMKPKPVLLIEGGRFRRRNMRRELVTEES